MDIEEEIARTLRDFLQPAGFEVTESDRIFAARVMPLMKLVQAEAWDLAIEAQRLLTPANEADLPRNPYIDEEVSDDE